MSIEHYKIFQKLQSVIFTCIIISEDQAHYVLQKDLNVCVFIYNYGVAMYMHQTQLAIYTSLIPTPQIQAPITTILYYQSQHKVLCKAFRASTKCQLLAFCACVNYISCSTGTKIPVIFRPQPIANRHNSMHVFLSCGHFLVMGNPWSHGARIREVPLQL